MQWRYRNFDGIDRRVRDLLPTFSNLRHHPGDVSIQEQLLSSECPKCRQRFAWHTSVGTLLGALSQEELENVEIVDTYRNLT